MRQTKLSIILLFLLLLISHQPVKAQVSYDEPYRPQFHFTPAQNWMNDPNGLVYYQGEYHLFYQYNPFGNSWGHMSWGHAVSKDLVHWQHLPVALAEENEIMIFSGSAVVDWNNTSGLCRNANPKDKSCLIAIYTGHIEQAAARKRNESQHLAVSNDRGRTWQKFAGNPVLDIGYQDFRDPKVIWHAATKQWVMVVSLSKEQKVRFYGSPDLKQWTMLSEFGNAGVKDDKMLWECPDLFELPVANQPNQKRWVLIVNINPGGVAGGSGGQYFIGQFDGKKFVNDNPSEQALYVDYGADFYAGVTFSDAPAGRRILIGWMSNWLYAGKEPTEAFRTAQSIPRELGLRKTAAGFRLWQSPIDELRTLRGRVMERRNIKLALNDTRYMSVGNALEIEAEFKVDPTDSAVLHLESGRTDTVIGYDPIKKVMFIDRTNSGEVSFHPQFAARHEVPLSVVHGKVRLHAFVDHSSVELFGNDGEAVITDRIFPPPLKFLPGSPNSTNPLNVYFYSSKAKCLSIKLWQLRSIWQ